MVKNTKIVLTFYYLWYIILKQVEGIYTFTQNKKGEFLNEKN